MGALLIALLVIAVVFSASFAVEALWYLALALVVLWIVGFLARGAERTWYRW